MARRHKKEKLSQIICFCNNVPRDVIERAINNGAQSLNEIYDKTTAGVGPCGGSCRRKIAPILETYLSEGVFCDVPEATDEEKNLTADEPVSEPTSDEKE